MVLMGSLVSNAWWVPLPFQYNTLLSQMETTYSVAKVCEGDKCYQLDPGKTME